MKSEDMIENPYILKYLNRLSDLIFVLACFEEKDGEERRKLRQMFSSSQLSDPTFHKWAIFTGSIILVLITAIILLLLFHKPAREQSPPLFKEHMEEMENMHKPSES